MKLFYLLILLVVPAFQLEAQEYPFKEKIKKADDLRAESKYDSALIVLKELREKSIEVDNLEYLTRSDISTGSLFFELEQYIISKGYYIKALKLAREIGNKRLENNAIYGIGATHQVEGQLDSAIFYYEIAERQFNEEGNVQMVSYLLNNMSDIHFSRKEFKLSIDKIRKSLKINLDRNYLMEASINYRVLGSIYDTLKIYDSARLFYFKAFEIADSMSYLENSREALNLLAFLEVNQGNFQKAYEYRAKSDTITRKIFVEGTNDEILNLREKYNTATLELENERQKNIAEQQRKSKFIILSVAIALIMIISVWLYIVNQRRKNMTLLAEKNEEINKQQIDELLQEQEIASLQGVLQGQESERKRVAMDLHDRLGGMLSMVKLHFSAFEERIDASDVKNQKFIKASELLDQATKEVREISHDLLSGVLTKFGLIPALEELKDKISSTGKLKVGIYSNDIKGALNAEQELQLYRIVQELLSNILKHAKAKETNIQLNRSGDSLNLIVEDDGVGFILSNSNEKGGIGLINLKARVAKLNGSFHIDSGKGGGTTISIDIPLNND
jgi:signal transduction histidine kinase